TPNGSTATFTADPAQVPAGSYTVHIVVDDGHGNTATQDFVITVGNHPPTVDPDAGKATLPEAPAAATLTFDANAGDVDVPTGDNIQIAWTALTTLPAGVSFDDNGDGTGTFSVLRSAYQQPAASLDVVFTLQVTVTDSHGAQAIATTTATII